MTKKKKRTQKFDNAIYMFIDAYLLVHGEISRNVLSETFGIANVKSSAIFKEYSLNRPSNMHYNFAHKKYIKGVVFTADHLGKIRPLSYLESVDLLFRPEIVNGEVK